MDRASPCISYLLNQKGTHKTSQKGLHLEVTSNIEMKVLEVVMSGSYEKEIPMWPNTPSQKKMAKFSHDFE